MFLFFLAVSAGFWIVLVLNDTTEEEIPVPVRLTCVPNNVVITEPLPDTIRVTVCDKGFSLFMYRYSDVVKPLKFNFLSYSRTNSKGTIAMSEVRRMLGEMLYASSKIVAIKPDKMEYSFNYGSSKKVKVQIDGQIKPAATYHLARMSVIPDSVRIYASEPVMKEITEIYTENLNIVDFTDTVTQEVKLKKIKGVKMVPDHVRVTLYADMLIEKVIQVPIVSVNMPEGLALRTFPTRVNVKVVVGRSLIDAIKPESFSVVVDYADVTAHPSDKCKLTLRNVPKGVTSAALETQQVDYLIESLK